MEEGEGETPFPTGYGCSGAKSARKKAKAFEKEKTLAAASIRAGSEKQPSSSSSEKGRH